MSSRDVNGTKEEREKNISDLFKVLKKASGQKHVKYDVLLRFNHKICLIVICVDVSMLKHSLILFIDKQMTLWGGGKNVKKLHNQPIIVNAWYILITASTSVTTPLLLQTEIMLPEGIGSVLLRTQRVQVKKN